MTLCGHLMSSQFRSVRIDFWINFCVSICFPYKLYQCNIYFLKRNRESLSLYPERLKIAPPRMLKDGRMSTSWTWSLSPQLRLYWSPRSDRFTYSKYPANSVHFVSRASCKIFRRIDILVARSWRDLTLFTNTTRSTSDFPRTFVLFPSEPPCEDILQSEWVSLGSRRF